MADSRDQASELPPISTAPVGDGFAIATTAPDELLRHNISDEELEMLCESRSDGATEGYWVAMGAMAASAPAAIPAMIHYPASAIPMSLTDLVQIVVFWVAACLLIVLHLIRSGRGNSGSNLRTQIRNRSRRRTA